jgi:proton-dependent oligopeptide transporter, POT family
MKQPRALLAISLTEMWERFGLYMVQGLLIFYMTKVLGFADSKSYAIMGQFTALVYISPIIGGLCADRFLGFRHTILIGAFLLLIGYASLTFPWLNKESAMFFGLSVIILGTGFLKPNLSSFLGCFYTSNDSRRDAGFTIYYMMFNFGITLSTLSSGYIQKTFGWYACFWTAALGLLLAIGFFRWGYRFYGQEGLPLKVVDSPTGPWAWLKNKGASLLIIVVGVALCNQLLKLSSIGNLMITIIGVLLLLILTTVTVRLESLARQKMLALLILIVISIAFWALFFQIFLVANIFIDRNVNREILGHLIPPMVFLSLESLFIFALSPLFIVLWKKLHEKQIIVSRGLQFTLALATIGLALQMLVIAAHHPDGQGLIHPYWIVICYLLITIGELLLSPIGLSMVTQLAPAKLVGMMMGVWFLGLSYGGLLAGYLGEQASVPKEMIHNVWQTNVIYAHAFQNYALLGFGAAILTLILTPWLNRLTKIR